MRINALASLVSALFLAVATVSVPAAAQQVIIQPTIDAVPVQQVAPPPVVYYEGPGCPIASEYELIRVLRGIYGVDALYRPVNAYGYPVDQLGRCLSPAPVGEVFNARPAPLYTDYLWTRYNVFWRYDPGFVTLFAGPGVIINRGYGVIPQGRTVIIQQHPNVVLRPAAPSTTVITGGGTTVRPGANTVITPPVGSGTTVRPGATTTTVAPPAAVQQVSPGATNGVRPGSQVQPQAAPPATVAPSTVMPSRPTAGTTSQFNRPGSQGQPQAAPPPAHVAPTTVMPQRPAAGTTSTFNRPTAAPPAASRPGRCMPGRPC